MSTQTPMRGGARVARRRRPEIGRVAWRRQDVARTVALLAVLAVMAEAVVDALPDDALFSVVTPLRLVIVVGLVAVAVAGLPAQGWATGVDAPLAALCVCAVIATVASSTDGSGLRGLLTAVVFFYLVVGLRRAWPESELAVAHLALIGVAITSAVAVGQAVAQVPNGFCRIGFTDVDCGVDGAIVRVTGTFSNPNLLAAFLLLLLPLAAYAVASTLDRGEALVGWGVLGMGLLALWCTHSRAGFLGIVTAGVVAALVHFAGTVPRWVRLVGGVAVAAVAVAGLAAGIGVRADVWRASVAAVLEHPAGLGLGASGPAISAWIGSGREFAHAHNLWLNWLVEAGIGGGLAVGTLSLVVLRRLHAATRVRPDGSISGVAIALAASVSGFATQSLADHPANVQRVAMVMWLVLALVETTTPAGGRGQRRGKRVANRASLAVPGPRRRA